MEDQSFSEYLNDSFYTWEERFRSSLVYPFPVHLEPPFEHFEIEHPFNPYQNLKDKGEQTSFFDALKEGVSSFFEKKIEYTYTPTKYTYTYPEKPLPFKNDDVLIAYKVSVPKGYDVSIVLAEQLLLMLSNTSAPVSFEIIGNYEVIDFVIVCRNSDSSHFTNQFQSYFPNIGISEINPQEIYLDPSEKMTILDMGLNEESMRPIKNSSNFNPDSFIGILACFEQLKYGESAMFQIMFQGCKYAWGSEILQSVSDGQGGSFFSDAPEMPNLAREKVSKALFSCVFRIAVQSQEKAREEKIATNLFQSISTLSDSGINKLIPLGNKGYDYVQHLYNLFHRQSNRLGILLNTSELVSFVHLPSSSVLNQKISRSLLKTKPASKELSTGKYFIGNNTHLGKIQAIFLDDEIKKRHIHIIGNTGKGKSTLMCNMVLDDISQGNGISFFDPHGDIIDDILARIPEHRKNDVILFDPSDFEFPIGFNLFQAKTELEKIVLSSDLLNIFKERSDSWGDIMTAVLSNTINVFLERKDGGTLLELRRFLLDAKFRSNVLDSIDDYTLRSYFEYDFNQLRKGALAPLLTRLDTFLRPKVIRNLMAQNSGIDFANVIESKKIFLVKLSQGLIGESNSHLLGTILIAKLQQAAQARQNISKENRHPHYLYIDEAHNFLTNSITSLLSGGRKYSLGLVFAHQQMSQISTKNSALADSLLSNPSVRIVFNVGDNDSKVLAQGFSYYEANDLQNLKTGECVVRIGSQSNDFNILTNNLDTSDITTFIEVIRGNTRQHYCKPKAEIEMIIQELYQFKVFEKKTVIQQVKEVTDTPKEEILQATTKVIKTKVKKQSEKFLEAFEEKEAIREHRYLQQFVKQMAEQNGYVAVIEEEVENGRIDVGLLKNGYKIACEISVTNTPDYEIKNCRKSLDKDYSLILMISNNEKHLNTIKDKAKKEFIKDEFHKIKFINSNELALIFQKLQEQNKGQNSVKRIGGYRVHTRYKAENIFDAEEKKKELNKIILKPKKKND